MGRAYPIFVMINTGTKVIRKRDNATGVVTRIATATSSTAHPGPFGKTIISIMLDDQKLAKQAGGEMIGDRAWFKSFFKVVK